MNQMNRAMRTQAIFAVAMFFAVVAGVGAIFAIVFGVIDTQNADNLKAQMDRCTALVTEGIETETKWSENFGCLTKRDQKWVRQ